MRRGRYKNKKPHISVPRTGGYKHFPPKEPTHGNGEMHYRRIRGTIKGNIQRN